MPSMATVTIIGHLGRDAETRYTPNGALNVTFSVAVNRYARDKQNPPPPNWWRVTAWGQLAETMSDLMEKHDALAKGDLVAVVGEPDTSEFTGDDGKLRFTLECNAQRITLLGGANGNT